MNGIHAAGRAKRKSSNSTENGPPAKRALNGKLSAGDNTPDVQIEFEEVSDVDEIVDDHDGLYFDTPGSLGEWQDTIQKVVRNVVAIRFCQTCAFDTDPALTSEATGFVVDSERGYGFQLLKGDFNG